MAYKVLNNVLVKDASNISSLSTDMLVLVINKNTKNVPYLGECFIAG